jgi:hypothetical protein
MTIAAQVPTITAAVRDPADVAAVSANACSRSDHFATVHLTEDLRGRSVRGGTVTLGAQALKLLLQLAHAF